MFPLSFVLLTVLSGALAAPIRRDDTTTLNGYFLPDLDSFTQFARATYCGADKLKTWTCGAACEANPNFQVTLAGGDGNAVQTFFVGFQPETSSVIVAHEGTDPTALLSVLTDIEVGKKELDATLFPGAPSGLEIHDGFADEHALTADQIRTEVQRLLAEKNATQVTTVGHSLGGALAELDALSLRLNLPDNIEVNAVTYGTPRVGTSDFATFFDSKVPDFKRVNNQKDIVPIVPGRFLGFAHPQGEIHIVDDDSKNVVSCPGNDNDDLELCQIKTVPSILSGDVLNHLGPYNGIHMGTIFC